MEQELRHLVQSERADMSRPSPHIVFGKRRLRLGDINVVEWGSPTTSRWRSSGARRRSSWTG